MRVMSSNSGRRIQFRRPERCMRPRLRWSNPLLPFVAHDSQQRNVLVIPLWPTRAWIQWTQGECFCKGCDRKRFYQLLAEEYGKDFAENVQQHHLRVRVQTLRDEAAQGM